MKRTQGFTLIELLVVIAIIGILSTVVLAALATARDKGKDASAKASLENIRAAAEIYLNNSGINGYAFVGDDTSSGGVCADADVQKLIAAAKAQTGYDAVCHHNATASKKADQYKVAIELKSGEYFCVDSTGEAVTTTTDQTGADTVCLP